LKAYSEKNSLKIRFNNALKEGVRRKKSRSIPEKPICEMG
jgi:hypothetical protein